MSKHTLTLTCACGATERFAADRRYLLIALLDASLWRVVPTSDGWGHVATCPACNGGSLTTAQHAEREFAA